MLNRNGSSSADSIYKLATACLESIDLSDEQLPGEFHYSSLGFCVVDSVFSIGVRYSQVTKLVNRCAARIALDPWGKPEVPTSIFLEMLRRCPADQLAAKVFENRGRTSTRNGILKADATVQFLETLSRHNVERKTDLLNVDLNALEKNIRKISGQASGISFKYFLMLAGDESMVKPDRMIQRFVAKAIGEVVTSEDCQKMLVRTAQHLSQSRPYLTPRRLDYKIWSYQRNHDA